MNLKIFLLALAVISVTVAGNSDDWEKPYQKALNKWTARWSKVFGADLPPDARLAPTGVFNPDVEIERKRQLDEQWEAWYNRHPYYRGLREKDPKPYPWDFGAPLPP